MSNQYLIVPLVAWLSAQLIKFVIRAFKGDIDARLLYVSGGMPSAHSAVVTALAATALILGGVSSPLFGVTFIFAGVVMYDALGVRRMAGEHAAAFNRLLSSLNDRQLGLAGESGVRELKGHQPDEVLAGAGLGFVSAVLFNTSRLSRQFTFLSSIPGRIELIIAAAIFFWHSVIRLGL